MKNKIIIISILILIYACKNKQVTEEISEPTLNENTVGLSTAQLKNANIESNLLEQKEIASTIKINGKIDVPPQNIISISAPMGGYLKSTNLLPGMYIKKGELIATLEDQQFIQLQQDYLLAKSKLHFAEVEYNRQKELNQSQATSDKITQQSLAEVNIQRIMMNATAEKLKLIRIDPEKITENNISKNVNIYSPINGYVSKVNVNIGKYLSPSDVIFELINPSDYHLMIHAFEKDITNLAIGQKVIAYNNINPEKKYQAKIILISKDISPQGTAEVHCDLDVMDKSILPGMYMNAEIQSSSKKAFVIPLDGIVHFEGKDYVFLANSDMTYQMLEIKLINSQNEIAQIEFLKNEDMSKKSFVTKGAYTLLMKMKNRAEE